MPAMVEEGHEGQPCIRTKGPRLEVPLLLRGSAGCCGFCGLDIFLRFSHHLSRRFAPTFHPDTHGSTIQKRVTHLCKGRLSSCILPIEECVRNLRIGARRNRYPSFSFFTSCSSDCWSTDGKRRPRDPIRRNTLEERNRLGWLFESLPSVQGTSYSGGKRSLCRFPDDNKMVSPTSHEEGETVQTENRPTANTPHSETNHPPSPQK
jgi:hypothetical protein